MSETPVEIVPVDAPTPPTQEAIIKAVVEKVNLKQLLASLGKEGGLKILKERTVMLTMPNGAAIVEMLVKELTKDQYDKLLAHTTAAMPEVPMISQHYTVARRDPLTGAVKPSGTYDEPNSSDPQYIAATQRWFNDCAVLFGLFAAADEFSLNLSLKGEALTEHLDEQVEKIANIFPVPTLLDIAYEASLVNRGIPIAEQLIGAVESHRAMMEMDSAGVPGGFLDTLQP